MLYEFHVPPGGVPKRTGVVVRISSPVEAVIGDAIPFLAGHLAGLAAYAHRRVSEECCCWAHVGCSKCCFHCLNAAAPRARRPGSMSHTSALVSMMRTLGSSEITR